MKIKTRSFRSEVFRSAFIVSAAICSALGLSACRDGSVDETCYWGPIPNEKRMEILKLRGVKTIVMVRLNPMHKVEENARRLGINYVHIPTGLFTAPPDEGIKQFVEIARNPANQPLYICDQVARDRTQFYAGLYGMLHEGWSADRASWQMYRNGLRHWWPWFYKYHRIAREHEEEIHKASSVVVERSDQQKSDSNSDK
jgi:hypothetical protein